MIYIPAPKYVPAPSTNSSVINSNIIDSNVIQASKSSVINSKVIQTPKIDYTVIDKELEYLNEIRKIWDNINQIKEGPVLIKEYKCDNCGAPLVIKKDNHIIVCPYCESAYITGTKMKNDN